MGLFSAGNSSSSTTNNTRSDSSGAQVMGDGNISRNNYENSNVTVTDSGIVGDALKTVRELIGAQLSTQQDYAVAALQAQSRAAELSGSLQSTYMQAALEDAAKARQADGGRSDSLIKYGLGVTAAVAVVYALFGRKK